MAGDLETSFPVQVGIGGNAVLLKVLHLSRPVWEQGDGADLVLNWICYQFSKPLHVLASFE